MIAMSRQPRELGEEADVGVIGKPDEERPIQKAIKLLTRGFRSQHTSVTGRERQILGRRDHAFDAERIRRTPFHGSDGGGDNALDSCRLTLPLQTAECAVGVGRRRVDQQAAHPVLACGDVEPLAQRGT